MRFHALKKEMIKVQINLESSFAAIETRTRGGKRDDVTNESTSFNEEGGPRVDSASSTTTTTDRK